MKTVQNASNKTLVFNNVALKPDPPQIGQVPDGIADKWISRGLAVDVTPEPNAKKPRASAGTKERV